MNGYTHKNRFSWRGLWYDQSYGAELFDFAWVKSIVLFFSYMAWAMFAVGFILVVFETAIAYENGQGNVGSTFVNILKGIIATSFITTLPIDMFKFAISMKVSISKSIADLSGSNIGIGLMLSANGMPRIADQLGLETTTRDILLRTMYATQNIVHFFRD